MTKQQSEPVKSGLAYRLLVSEVQTEKASRTRRSAKQNGYSQQNQFNKNKMNVKPLSDRVLILPNPAEEKTVGGLIIPDTAKEKPLAGKVVAVGPGTSDVKMEVKVGDQVLYGKYAGQEISVDGTDYLIMKQSDILAII